jgi:cation diffusion facilitator family transporter
MHTQEAIKTTYISLLGNILLALIKGAVGIVGHSYAMIADAIESTTDIFSSIIVLIGLKVSSRPADQHHPYGYGKAEALATFAVAAMLIVSATLICIQSIDNINTPHEAPASFTLWVLGAIILFKEGSYHYVNAKSKKTKSTSLKADAWHHRSDAMTSLAAFIGISIALIMGDGYETADDWAALFASGVIFANSYFIIKPALGEMMDEHQYDLLIADIREHCKSIDGVLYTEKCLVRKMGMKYFIDLHIIVFGTLTVREGHDIAHGVKDHLMKKMPEIADVLIHVEPDYLAPTQNSRV